MGWMNMRSKRWIILGCLGASGLLVILCALVAVAVYLLDDEEAEDEAASEDAAVQLFNGFGELAVPRGASVSITTDEEGGSFEVEPGARIIVPPGSLNDRLDLQVEPVDILAGVFEPGSGVIWAYTIDASEDVDRLEQPIVLEQDYPAATIQAAEFVDGEWLAVELEPGDTARVQIDHFSTRTFAFRDVTTAYFGEYRFQFIDALGTAWQSWFGDEASPQDEARNAQRIAGSQDPGTRGFFGVDHGTTLRPHDAICTDFERMIAQADRARSQLPPAYSEVSLARFLFAAATPRETMRKIGTSDNFWTMAGGNEAYREVLDIVQARPANGSLSPAQFLEITTQVRDGNVLEGVLLAHNVLKEITYAGRLQGDTAVGGDPSHPNSEGTESDVSPALGEFMSRLEPWRRSSPTNPKGRYDKGGPLYHIFATMTLEAWLAEGSGTPGAAFEGLLRGLGIGRDVGDPEKGAADQCGVRIGRHINDWLAGTTTAPLSVQIVEYDAAPPVGESFGIEARATGGSLPYTYRFEWDGPDQTGGVFSVSGNPATEATLTAPGDYLLRVIVQDGAGSPQAIDEVAIQVTSSIEVAIINSVDQLEVDDSFAFIAEVTGGLEPYEFSWTASDGTAPSSTGERECTETPAETCAGSEAMFTFGTPGVKTVTVSVQSIIGESASAETTVTVLERGAINAPRWVLVDTRINPGNHPLEDRSKEEYNSSYAGSIDAWTVTATGMTAINKTIYLQEALTDAVTTFIFDAPPGDLDPGQVITLTASGEMSVSAAVQVPFEQFEYHLNGNRVPGSYFGVKPDALSGSISVDLVIPDGLPGDEFTISALLWNCSACRVDWVYRAE